MEHDVEAEAEGHDEERVPEEEGEEGGEDAEEHGGVDVAPVLRTGSMGHPPKSSSPISFFFQSWVK